MLSLSNMIADYRVLGAVFLIASATLGAGILALPFAFDALGFFFSILLLFCSWLVMAYGGFLLIELSCHVFRSHNLYASMGSVAGKLAQRCTSILFLSLFYALISAYLAAGTDIVMSHFIRSELTFYAPLVLIWVLLLLTMPVILGVESVDVVTRILFVVKIAAFTACIFVFIPWVQYDTLWYGSSLDFFYAAEHLKYSSWIIALSAFGFHICIPFLVNYLNFNKKKLYLGLFWGTFIPFLIYFFWLFSVFGLFTPRSLMLIPENVDALIQALAVKARAPMISFLLYLFADIALISSFLAVSMGLFDFLKSSPWLDFNLKQSQHKLLVYVATFVPPLLFNFLIPNGFVWFLSFSAVPLLGLTVGLPIGLSHLCKGFASEVAYGRYLHMMNLVAIILTLGIALMPLFFLDVD